MATSTSPDRIGKVLARAKHYLEWCVRLFAGGYDGGATVQDDSDAGFEDQDEFLQQTDLSQPPPIRRYPMTGNAQRIEAALRALASGQLLIVDTAGQVHTDKAPFATCEVEPLASFVRSIDGGFTVYAGVPASNKTFCGTGVPPSLRELESGECEPLRYDGIVLNSGDWISLAHGVCIPIPFQGIAESSEPAVRLASLLSRARRGERVYLGRLTEPDCPEYVSRVHVTAQVLSRIEGKDGSCAMQVRVIRGVAAARHIAVIGVGGREQPILGSMRLQPGSRLALGNGLGEIVLPPMMDSSEKRISEVYAARAYTNTTPRGNEEEPFDSERDRVRLLEYHIKAGLLMMSRHSPSEAIVHFMGGELLRALGLSLGEGNLVFLRELTPAAVTKSLDRIRTGTIYNAESRYIIVGQGVVAPGLVARDADEERLLYEWHRTVGTIYAAVLIKALKHLLGKMEWLSQRGELLATHPLGQELDVAAFIEEHGVWLDKVSFGESQLDLAEGMERLRGYQLLKEQESFSKRLRQLPFDCMLVIGRGPKLEAGVEDPHYFGIPPDVSLEDARGGYDRLYRRRGAVMKLQEREVGIKRCSDGSYLLSPFPDSTVFVPDTSGRYQRLMQPRHVPPQTSISLGGVYTLVVE